ncbi:MAG: serine hydrolase [Bradyrhizobium sp.]
MAELFTALLLGWVFLGIVLVGGWPAASGHPIPAILFALIAVTGALATIAARYVAPWRSVVLAITLLFASVAVSAVTWSLSAPDQALYLARGMALDGSDVRNYLKYPQRGISKAVVVFPFQQNLAPQLFQTIVYRQGGQTKQSSFDDLLKVTRTTSLIVVKDHTVLYEGYANGYTRGSIINSYSIAKSFTSALIGIAIDEKLIGGVDDLMVSYLPELRGKGLDGVTLQNLLTMSAGIHYSHEDEQPPLLNRLPFNDDSRCTNYPDLRSLVLSVGDAPGKVFEYNNFAPLLLGLILERTTHHPVSQYLQEKIWQPHGMEYPASWSLDSERSGFEKMAMGLNARAIDFAKFGALMLDNGRWYGNPVIPEK